MAQFVSFWQDACDYREGPFVVCCVPFSSYRIEIESRRRSCPGEPHESLSELMRELDAYAKTQYRDEAERRCDRLNVLVREGRIVFRDPDWVLAGDGEAR